MDACTLSVREILKLCHCVLLCHDLSSDDSSLQRRPPPATSPLAASPPATTSFCDVCSSDGLLRRRLLLRLLLQRRSPPVAFSYAGNLGFVLSDPKNRMFLCSFLIVISLAKDTFKVPFKSEGKGNFRTVSFKFKAVAPRTRLTFYSSFYHTRIDDYGSLCGPVLDQVIVFPVT
ncbi:hypothetical protein Ahy_B06g082611 isoform B [Arachis hypogaea]|uniref:DUF642 domain-containing protein n=1 Tax=Arachis hypogaea TaxID=3818 RepID=A0A444YNN3_ARAHY|nr:hypothetical protein Ahy_B06g082611 isoform B [Arachis hypogaea]